MKIYYKAIGPDGKALDGFLTAKSRTEAASYIRKQGLFPIKIVEHKESDVFGLFSKKKTISSKDRVFFTRQLSTMLNSGLTLIQALNILKDQSVKKNLRDVIINIITDIEAGSSFSGAIEKYPTVFSPIYISLVKAAESSGLMDKVLDRLATTLEKQQELREKVRGALVYPIIVILLMFGVSILMMVLVIPQISTLYESFDADLPLPTQVLIGLSNITVAYWPVLIIGLIIGGYGLLRFRKTPNGKYYTDKAILKIPIVGKLISENILTEFSRTLGLLVGAGSAIVPSLRMLREVSGNSLFEAAISQASFRVEKGVSVGDALSVSHLFPQYLIQMIKIGEQSGKLDESLMKASVYYEDEVERVVKTLTTAMEPFIIIVLGVGVGFLLISVISPIYQLTSAF